jgi:hypothetical protein
VYAPEALAQLSDNAFALMGDTGSAKLIETAVGAVGALTTELVPQLKGPWKEALREYFSHLLTKILDPTPAEWQQMIAKAQAAITNPGASFANPLGDLQKLGQNIQANLAQAARSFSLPALQFPAIALPAGWPQLPGVATPVPAASFSAPGTMLLPGANIKAGQAASYALPGTSPASGVQRVVNVAAASLPPVGIRPPGGQLFNVAVGH